MAYYIDDAKKTAIKGDGKSVYGWNRETWLFDLPETDSSPKSRYAMEMSNVGQYLATSLELLESNLDLAKDSLEFAKLKETAEECKGGHCEECTIYQDC